MSVDGERLERFREELRREGEQYVHPIPSFEEFLEAQALLPTEPREIYMDETSLRVTAYEMAIREIGDKTASAISGQGEKPTETVEAAAQRIHAWLSLPFDASR